jgi:hypothetical protein
MNIREIGNGNVYYIFNHLLTIIEEKSDRGNVEQTL